MHLPGENQEKLDRLSVLISGFGLTAKLLEIPKLLSGSGLAIANAVKNALMSGKPQTKLLE